ncbi:VTT domain-containing protein [Parendozoicomonas haliclonae]|uniref:VTT domain-containing protein n=1 Tax=Parendozoicomonas haliclonae TaxID=1960125 RepID=UPI0013FDBADE|nr:VTT domain-containing protein [Parendozoicomonas haliclonae]
MAELSGLADWLAAHQQWLAFIIGLIAFAESLALVGIILPGVVMLFSAATLAGSGVLDVWSMLLAGFIGALLGDGISFLLGYKFHDRIRGWWPFRSHPEWLNQGETFFDRHGGVSIALGRFIGPIRPVIPLVAGMMGMPARYFFIVNVLSSLVWAPVYLLPGYFVGASLHWKDHLPVEWLVATTVLLFIAVYAAYLCRYLLIKISADKLYRTGFLTALIYTIGISVLAMLPAGMELNTYMFDHTYSLHTPLLDKLFSAVTATGEFFPTFGMFLFALFWLGLDALHARNRAAVMNFFVYLVIALALKGTFEGMKLLYALPRPEPALSTSFSYPSGHTACMIFLTLWPLWYIGRYLSDRYKPWLWSLGLFIGLLVGESRVYKGEHWFVDVLGGFGLGLSFFMLWLIWENKHPLALSRNNFYWRLGQLAIFCAAVVYWT